MDCSSPAAGLDASATAAGGQKTCAAHAGTAAASRRGFLRFGANALVAAGAVTLGSTGAAAIGLPKKKPVASTKRLNLHHRHTGETINLVYASDGIYHLAALTEVDYFLRDWRNSKVTRTDPQVLDLLADIHAALDTTTPLEILSGYRSPETNEWLRKRGRRAAKNSLHMRGMAIDFYCPDRSLKGLRNTARTFKVGGVGYYPRSGFIHVDTGPIRYW